MGVLSFISMYVLMYAMVDEFQAVYANLNQFYMAGLMTAPMIVIEMLLMTGMYPHRRINLSVIAASVIAGVALFWLIRAQTQITDAQFLRSMIPHHSGAILMCSEAPLSDAGIKDLCNRIISSQRAEIAEMEAKLKTITP